jgi:L-threonylcarbamoyladenylate synthase
VRRVARCRPRTRSSWQEKNRQEDRDKEENEKEDCQESGEKEGRQEEDFEEMKGILYAADVLFRGGVMAYPTDGVYGLGCLPDDLRAVRRVIDIKRRDASKGLILIAANAGQLDGWIGLPDRETLPEPDPSCPVTWIVPPGSRVSPLLRGGHATIAVRLTTNPVAKALCEATDSPLVSTSANLTGKPTARNRFVLRRQFAGIVDYIVPGDCGPASGPSEIRDYASGRVLRPRTT